MGDGSARSHGLTFCTDSYSVSEVVGLINILIIRYRLDCASRYHTPTQPRIFISNRYMGRLRQIVQPFM